MIYIAHYHHLTWRLRKERQLPELDNPYDLPLKVPADSVDTTRDANNTTNSDPTNTTSTSSPDIEASATTAELPRSSPREELSVLSPKQQAKLNHHTAKFSKSHTFYKAHETTTHRAFSVGYLIAIVVLLDCHSLLQMALGACTWGISYHVRPQALTAVILSFSISCNVTAGILISVGDRLSRKKDVVERMFRQTLTQEALEKVRRRKGRAHGAVKRTASLEAVERTAAAVEEMRREEREEEEERKRKEKSHHHLHLPHHLHHGRSQGEEGEGHGGAAAAVEEIVHARPEKYIEAALAAPHDDLKTEAAVLRSEERDTHGDVKMPG